MKTEKFDDAFKRKFDSLDETSAYSEEEIDKVQYYVNSRMQKPFFVKRFGALLFATFTGILMAVLFGWNLLQHQEQKVLIHTIDSLQNKLAQVKPYVTHYKTDTVYLTNIPHLVVIHPATARPAYAQSKLKARNDARQAGNYMSRNEKTQKQINKVSKNKKELLGKELTKENLSTAAVPFAKENSILGDSSLDKNNHETAIEPAKIQDTLTTASAPDKPSTAPVQENKLFAAFKNLHYQAGAGSQSSKWQNGFEVVGAVLFNSRWSFSAGLKIVKIKSRHYGDSAMFHDFQGGDFNDPPPPFQKDTFAIPNNGMRYTLLQVPLTLAYSIPLKYNYSLLMGIGTDLDLYASQSFGYNHLKNKGQEEHKDHDARTPVRLINTMTLSAGLQKQWRSLSLQAGPYISPQINEVLYKKENLYAGIRFRILYNF